MPEINGTVEAIEQWEEYPKGLAQLGVAELVHDTTKDKEPLFEKAQEDILDYVRVYHVFVGSGINMLRVAWRFHFDKRPGAESSLRITKKGLQAMRGSMTVMSLVNKLNIEISGNNGFDFEKLKLIMQEALVILEDRKKKENKKEEVLDGA